MICAYCGERPAIGWDKRERFVCAHCAALPEPSPEALRIAEAMIDAGITAGMTVQ